MLRIKKQIRKQKNTKAKEKTNIIFLINPSSFETLPNSDHDDIPPCNLLTAIKIVFSFKE